MQFSGHRRNLVDLDLVNSVVDSTQILVIGRRDHTAHMRPEVALGDRTDPLMEHSVQNRAQTPVSVRVDNRYLTVVIAAYEQELARDVSGQVAASHTVDIYLVDRRQASVRLDLQDFDTLIRNRVQKLAASGLRDVGGIVDRNDIPFLQDTVLTVHIIDMDPNAASVGIGPDISYILFIFHKIQDTFLTSL